MGQLMISGGRSSTGFNNPYNFPLTISMDEPTPKAVGHIWVESESSSEINNIVIDDAFKESYPNGTLLLKEVSKDENYTISCSKKDTNGVARPFTYSRKDRSSDTSLPWQVGTVDKSGVVNYIRHIYPLIYLKLNDAIDITDSYVWTGTMWEVLSKKGSLLATGSSWDTPPYDGIVSCLNVYNISNDDFIYTPDTQIPNVQRGWRGLQFSEDGQYLIALRNMQVTDDPYPDGLHIFKRQGITFTEVTSTFFASASYNPAIDIGHGFSHDGKRFAYSHRDSSVSPVVDSVKIGTISNGTLTTQVSCTLPANYICITGETIIHWSSDDKYIAFSANNSGHNYIAIANTLTGEIKLFSNSYLLNSAIDFIYGTHDMIYVTNDSSSPALYYLAVTRFDEATKTFISIPLSADTSIPSGNSYPPSTSYPHFSLSKDSKYIVRVTSGGTNAYYDWIAKIYSTGDSSYAIKPLYSYDAKSDRQGAIFIPNNRIIVYGRSKVDAFKVDPDTDALSADAETQAKFNNKHIPFGVGYLDAMAYYNWN